MEFSKALSSSTIDRSTKLQKHDDHEDRLSQLPEEILHQIFSAPGGLKVRALSMLSKRFLQYSRRYPKLGFLIGNGNGEPRMIDATLQRYTQQKLVINKFTLSVSNLEDALVSSIKRWLDVVVSNTHLKELDLYITSQYFISKPHVITYNIHSSIFSAKNLTRLFIHGNVADGESSVSIGYNDFEGNKHALELPSLRTLRLFKVKIKPCVLQKLISNCPNIETLSLSNLESKGLRKLQVHGLQKIQILSIRYCKELENVSIKNTPYLETVSITGETHPQVDIDNAPGVELKDVYFSS